MPSENLGPCISRAKHDELMKFLRKELERKDKIIEKLEEEKRALVGVALKQSVQVREYDRKLRQHIGSSGSNKRNI